MDVTGDPETETVFAFDLATVDVTWTFEGGAECATEGGYWKVLVGTFRFTSNYARHAYHYQVSCLKDDVEILMPIGSPTEEDRFAAGAIGLFPDDPEIWLSPEIDVPETGGSLEVAFIPEE